MEIYLDSEGVLHIDNKIYSKNIPLIFLQEDKTKFDIKVLGKEESLLGRTYDLSIENITNLSGVKYLTIDDVYNAIKSIFNLSKIQISNIDGGINNVASATNQTDGSQKTQVVDQNGHPLRTPDHVDTVTTVNVVYRGFDVGTGTTLLINKVNITNPADITRTWATGTWVNRTTLTYA